MKIPNLSQIKAKLLLAVAAASLLCAASQAAIVNYPGFVKVERFDGAAGGLNGLLTNAKYTGNTPDSVKFITSGYYNIEPNLDGFGARITGFITPLETADYVFFVSADDATALYLSTDATPANLKLIAADVGWQGDRVWTGAGGMDAGQTPPYRRGTRTTGEAPYENRSDQFLQSPQNTGANATAILDPAAARWPTLDTEGRPIIHLVEGQKYYFQQNFSEGTGGAHADFTWKKATDDDPAIGSPEIGPDVLSVDYTDTLSFARQPPATITTLAGQVVNFVSEAIGFPGGVSYQWFVDGVAIDDGSGSAATYTINAASVAEHNGKKYKVVATSLLNGEKTATSQETTLTVSEDNVAPQLSRVRSAEDMKTVRVIYSETVNDEALNTANYVFNPPLTVEDAIFDVDLVAEFNEARTTGDDPRAPTDPRKRVTVILTVSGMTEGATYTLTVNGVADLVGNALNPKTKTVNAPVFRAGTLNYKRWMTGNNVAALLTDVNRYINPSIEGTLTIAESVAFGGNYVDRISGFFVPPANGDYVFLMSADNDGFLYLSTDADPANRKLIAADVGWQNARVWTGSGGDATKRRGDFADHGPFENRSDEFLTSQRVLGMPEGGTTGPTAGQGLPGGVPTEDGTDPEPWPTRNEAGNAVITLEANKRYYFELYHQEGDSGRVEVTYKVAGATDPANGVASVMTGNVVGTLVDPSSLLPTIGTQPTTQNFTVGGTITFTVVGNSAQPMTYQWYKNEVALAGKTESTLTINNATLADIGSYRVVVSNENGGTASVRVAALAPVTAPGLTFQEDNSNVTVVEAEHYFAARTANDGKVWVPANFRADASGGSFMWILPDTDQNLGNAGYATSAKLDFKINFKTAGLHYLWIRGGDPRADGASDSVHAGINDVVAAPGTQITGAPTFNTLTWAWVGANNAAARVTVDVPSPGIHTVSLWMREDGFMADKILLTMDSAFTPTGQGPAESAQVSDAPNVSIVRNANGSVTISWTGGGRLTSNTVIGTTTGWGDVANGATSPVTITPATTGNVFYRVQQ